MRNQQWFTVGISSIAAGAIASILFSSRPIAIVAASTAGALGGSLVRSKDPTTDRLARLEHLLGISDQNKRAIALPPNTSDAPSSVDTPHRQSKRTAILYDVENLLKGYNFSRTLIENLSLGKIVEDINQNELVGPIFIQKAYANWGDPRLKVMRVEINEIGITPVQVFGFSHDPTKNAADIQLVIDAVNILTLQPFIDVFVIVSGDGGFAALAKQLREYGKTVIGCAYKQSTSKTFQAVCDDFIQIDDPEHDGGARSVEKPILAKDRTQSNETSEPPPEEDPAPSIPPKTLGLDPRNVRLVKQIEAILSSESEETLAKTRDVLQWYASDDECRSSLSGEGIYLSTVEQAISQVIPGLETLRLGLPKFVEYLQYVCKDSDLCIVRIPPSKVVLMLREAVSDEVHQVLPDLDVRGVHTVETYRSILESGRPLYRIPPPDDLYAIAQWMIRNPAYQAPLQSMIEAIVADLDSAVSSDAVKNTIYSCLAAGLLIRSREGKTISEQILSFRKGITSVDTIVCSLKIGASQKLAHTLPYVDEEILQSILPDIA
ncbi:MAG: NYN domain-containing protein [Leptolyngbyaceae bacterium]|nr:NYN domain-containing protein [Leptolyngbyaceae bacterium]